MTTFVTSPTVEVAPQNQAHQRLLGWVAGVVQAARWALEVKHGCDRARAAGETIDGATIRRVAAAADAALGVS